jgi:hypothetical protein
LPLGPHEIGRAVEMHPERAAISALDRLADTPRQVNVGRRDDKPCLRALDVGDPVERVLRFFGCLFVTREAEDFAGVLPGEIAMQRQDPRGQPILDAAAGRTYFLFCRDGLVRPLSPAAMIDPAGCRLFELLPRLVGVKHTVLPSASGGATVAMGRS